jgi:hypothetical protein
VLLNKINEGYGQELHGEVVVLCRNFQKFVFEDLPRLAMEFVPKNYTN